MVCGSFFTQNFLLSVVCLVALHQRVGEEKGRCALHCPAKKSDIKIKESQTHASSHPSSHDDDAKRERKQKEEERTNEICGRQAHFRSKHVLGVRQQEGTEEEEE